MFTISDRIADTGFAIVYAYSWRTIAIWPTIVREFGVAALILVVLWTLVIAFDLKVFAPVFRRSRRVFETDEMSRAIIATSPFGIVLVSLDTDAVLLRNRMHELYESAAGEPPLHERLLVNFVRVRYRGKDTLLCGFSDITTRADTELALDSANRAIPPAPASTRGPLPRDLRVALVDATNRANAAIARALEYGDLKAARAEIHSMRGAFAMIGERDVSGLCASLETLGLAGDAVAFAREFEQYRSRAEAGAEQRADPLTMAAAAKH
ncbi:Hpt domain-containing protein [Burkholderia sp. RS02]|uniref:Hpt domain-containing protein n=1 Tax=unclassified Burkholderia TaxID=2613784 RepID=UPI0032187444